MILLTFIVQSQKFAAKFSNYACIPLFFFLESSALQITHVKSRSLPGDSLSQDFVNLQVECSKANVMRDRDPLTDYDRIPSRPPIPVSKICSLQGNSGESNSSATCGNSLLSLRKQIEFDYDVPQSLQGSPKTSSPAAERKKEASADNSRSSSRSCSIVNHEDENADKQIFV